MKRSLISLLHDWTFLRCDAEGADKASYDDSWWESISVPHCFNADDTILPKRGYYRGPTWYRRHIPAGLSGRVELDVLGAFQVTDAWINGEHLGQFMGGFTGFTADLTPYLKSDGSDVLAMRVTNEHDPEILPGRDRPDYNLYGGVYREVYLRVTDPLHIPDRGLIVNTPEVSADEGEVQLDVLVRNDRADAASGTLTATISAPDGTTVSTACAEFSVEAGGETTVSVPVDAVKNPVLWSTDTPVLYSAGVSLSDDAGVVDEDRVSFGFRWYKFDADKGFFLNGQQVKLHGVNRHQDFPGLGNALPASFQSLDVEILKDAGANYVRCSHYPMHPAFLDACDQIGLLVFEEIASWQHIGGERFAKNAQQMMREMIARDRHHPSIIIWGLLNEGRNRELFQMLHDTAHECDPYRATSYAENEPDEGLKLGTVNIPDVLGLNYKVPHLDELREQLPGFCLANSEHSNANIGELPGADLAEWVDNELWQVDRVLHDLDEFEKREWLAGSALWCMHDYGTDYEPVWPKHESGSWDGYRAPKLSAYGIRAKWNPEPLVKIATHWTWSESEGDTREVRVIANTASVELFLNGRSLGSKSADDGFAWDVAYEPGELKAVGTGDVVDVVKTAGAPVATMVEVMDSEMEANGTDVTIITASIVDADGVICPTERCPVSFFVSIDGEEGGADFFGIGGYAGLQCRKGQGRIILRAGRESGTLTIRAEAPKINDEGEATITLI
jgi:beta-galactosidase